MLRTNRLAYYTKNILLQLIPSTWNEMQFQKKMAAVKLYHKELLKVRVDYYNKLDSFVDPGKDAPALSTMDIFKSPKAYNFDTYEYTRYFDKNLRANLLFGDIIHTPEVPALQKSRPANGENKNAVILKLDKLRHFVFLNDDKKFSEKKDMLIGRMAVHQPHRIVFMEKYFNHPLCDLGQVNESGGKPEWLKAKMPVKAHLDYKFILSLEGNDVATNLKWIMSSSSVAVMPKPKFETWFMEGTLKAGHHYIEINDDYSDLEEKLKYYIAHPEEAEQISRNANEYVKQFKDKRLEDVLSMLVLQKYFYYTGQIDQYALL